MIHVNFKMEVWVKIVRESSDKRYALNICAPLRLPCACLAAAVLGIAMLAAAQPEITWQTLDGGGGTSTGGVYAVSGTIGQPDAGVSAGGAFRLSGGFWNAVSVVQTPGAPILRIARNTSGAVVLVWAAQGAEGYRLQEAAILSADAWADVATPPTVVDGDLQVVVAAGQNVRFYRLAKPKDSE